MGFLAELVKKAGRLGRPLASSAASLRSSALAVCVSLIMLALLLAALWWNQLRNEEAIRQHTGQMLTASGNMNARTVDAWFERQRGTVQGWARLDVVEGRIRRMLTAPPGERVRLESELRELLDAFLPRTGYTGYAFLDAEGGVLLASNNECGARLSQIPPESRKRVLTGKPAVGFPRSGLARVEGQKSALFSAAPILGENGESIGLLALAIDPAGDFTRMLRNSHFGDSGETYAVNAQGVIVSESRFGAKIGLRATAGKPVKSNAAALPLSTLAGRMVNERRDSEEFTPYADYRGVQVIGVARWLENSGVGIITEVDADEAYKAIAYTRWQAVLQSIVLVQLYCVLAAVIWGARHLIALREEKARQSESRMKGAINAMPAPLLLYDHHDCLLAFNRAAEKAFEPIPDYLRIGKPLQEMVWESFATGRLSAGEGLDAAASYIKVQDFVMGRMEQGGAVDLITSDGRNFEVQRVETQGGAAFIFFDVTDRMRAQEEIRSANAELEKRVHERTLKLERANEELREMNEELQDAQAHLVQHETMASLGSMVAGIAHEINTPLGVCVTAASHFRESVNKLYGLFDEGVMTRSDFTKFQDLSLRTMEILERNLYRASQLVRSFKSVSADQIHEEIRAIDLGTYVEEVATTLEPMMKKGGHTLKVSIEASAELETYPGVIAQIISNLVANAVAHGFDERGGLIRVSLKNGGLNSLRLTVEDSGKGISPEVEKKMFEPFFTTKRKSGGTGLGLSTVFNLVVKQLGGRIDFRRSELGGARFDISLPLGMPGEVEIHRLEDTA